MKFTSHDFSQEFFPHKFPVFSTITKYKIMSHALKLKFTFHEIHIFFFYVIHFLMCQCSLSCEFYVRYDFLYMYVCYSLFFTCN